MKLFYPDSRVTARQHFFSVRVVQLWNKLPEEVVSAGNVSAFISRLNLMHILFFNVLFQCSISSHLSIFPGSCKFYLSLIDQLTQFCFLLFILLYCVCVDK